MAGRYGSTLATFCASDRFVEVVTWRPMIANVIVVVLTLLIVVRFFMKYGH